MYINLDLSEISAEKKKLLKPTEKGREEGSKRMCESENERRRGEGEREREREQY